MMHYPPRNKFAYLVSSILYSTCFNYVSSSWLHVEVYANIFFFSKIEPVPLDEGQILVEDTWGFITVIQRVIAIRNNRFYDVFF